MSLTKLTSEQREKLIQRIHNRMEIDPVSGCWNSNYCIRDTQVVVNGKRYKYGNRYGYRQMRVGGHIIAVHRVAYHLYKGHIQEGMHIDHLCNNPSCCNPDHLDVVTHAENKRRQAERNRAAKNQEAQLALL